MTTITVGAAAAAVALAGVIGLKVAGLAALAFHGGRSHGGHGGYGHSQHSHGYGGHHQHGHGYGYGRKKRSAELEAEALEGVMEMIRQEDVSGCGLRLVCELGAAEEGQLSIEEISILNLVGPVIQPGEGLLPDSASVDYRAARTYGSSNINCTEAYPKCPIAGEFLMDSVISHIP